MLKIKNGFTGERSLVVPQLITNIIEQHPLISTLYITDIGYYPNALHHFIERDTVIDQFVMILCVNGEGYYRLDQTEYKVVANQYFILPKGIPHSYHSNSDNPWSIYWIHFKGKLAECYMSECCKSNSFKPESCKEIMELVNIFENMYNTLKNGYSIENLNYVTSMFHFFLGSLNFKNSQRDTELICHDNIVENSILYMKQNIEKHITISDISQHIGYSQSYISMIFKSKTGHTPISYMNLLKIQYACDLLDNTDMKINQVSYKIGINDNLYFSRLFSKIMGKSPKKYRQRKKG